MKISNRLLYLWLAAVTAGMTSAAPGQASLAPPPPPPATPQEAKLEGEAKMNRAAIGVAGGVAGYHVIKGVGGAARSVVHQVPVIKDIPVYSHAIGKLPVIGPQVLKTSIPTHVGGMPFIGKAVADIPVVGPVIAGPPHPILVGAVAVETYVLPKYAPCGWTESALFTKTDFNSAPVLRQYVNYLAPLPYTHPPIYAPSTSNYTEPVEIPIQTPNLLLGDDQPGVDAVEIDY